jgi:hypothetical protein
MFGDLHAFTLHNRAQWTRRRRGVSKSNAAIWVELKQAVALYVHSGIAVVHSSQ